MTNATATSPATTIVPATPKKKPTEYTLVKMDDGRSVEFTTKRRLNHTPIENEDGTLSIRFDCRNGEFRVFTLPIELLAKFALAGANSVIRDAVGKYDDIEDMVAALDDKIDTLHAGQFDVIRAEKTFVGGGLLARALSEGKGITVQRAKDLLKACTPVQRAQIRVKFASIYARLEAEKLAKGKDAKELDLDAMLADDGESESESAAAPALL